MIPDDLIILSRFQDTANSCRSRIGHYHCLHSAPARLVAGAAGARSKNKSVRSTPAVGGGGSDKMTMRNDNEYL